MSDLISMDPQTEYIMPKLSARLKPCPACGSAAQMLYLPRWRGENNDAGGFMADCMECSLCTRPIPWDDDDLTRVLIRHELREEIKKHSGLKGLDADVRAYLKDAYHSGRSHING